MSFDKRLYLIYTFFWVLFAAVFLRIGYVQLIKGFEYKNFAEGQYYKTIPFKGKRGMLIDRVGRELGVSLSFYSVYVDPLFVADLDSLVQDLSRILEMDVEDIRRRIRKAKRFAWIKRKLPWDQKEKVRSLNIPGVFFSSEDKRFYPEGKLAASVLGLVNVDNHGVEGLEYEYDKYLRGKDGTVEVLSDSSSHELLLTPNILEPQKGRNLFLSIDSRVQLWTEVFLEETVKEYDAKAGGVIVMNAVNGQIYALANYPYFDPNNFTVEDSAALRNNVVSDFFEPGSVFKIVTLLAAIDNNVFKDDDMIFCENGAYKVPGTTLNDYRPYGALKFKEVFMNSSNIGVVKIADKLGKERLYEYIGRLGFGQVTGIDLPGETQGMVTDLKNWSRTSPYIVPIGQEIGVTLLQLARACAVIANGGFLVGPHLVNRVEGLDNVEREAFDRVRVVSESSALHAKDILVEVVANGTGKRAYIQDRRIGGKTGTAQKYDPVIRRYSPNKYRANFVGFLDDLDEPVVIAVTIDEPRKSHFGGVVAAPLFKKIAEKVLVYSGGQDYETAR
ncbi:MAG: penicillin-binding protein 2 [Candidatus Omnitrophica bacterium]|nr:penicillin-binding protein 2 [Candidatus Omnitrophota bacterium]